MKTTPRRTWVQWEMDLITAWFNDGKSDPEIGRELGVSPKQIRHCRKSLGLKRANMGTFSVGNPDGISYVDSDSGCAEASRLLSRLLGRKTRSRCLECPFYPDEVGASYSIECVLSKEGVTHVAR